MSSSSSVSDSESRPGHNGDYAPEDEDEIKDLGDAENYDSDLDLTKDVQPISAYLDDRDELFRQVLTTLEPEGRMDALIPEILTVLSRIELDQLCLDHIKIMSSKKLKKIMEGADIAEISSDEDEENANMAEEPAPKWKPLQNESANVEVESLTGENGYGSRSSSRSSSRSRSSSFSGSSVSRKRHSRSHRDRHRKRRGSRHRRHRHGRRRHKHESSRRRRRHHHRSEESFSEIEKEDTQGQDHCSMEATSIKSGSGSMPANPMSVPVLYDIGSNVMFPVMPNAIASSGSSFPPTFMDPTFAAASANMGLQTTNSTVNGLMVSSAAFSKKKSQYDVTEEDDMYAVTSVSEDCYEVNGNNQLTLKAQKLISASSRLQIPLNETILQKAESTSRSDSNRETTPPPPGVAPVEFDQDNGDEPEPPGTANVVF